jgi:hypothetical protein
MKKFFTVLVAIISISNLLAQSPEKMSYQAVVRNSSNNLVTNTQIGMRISILHESIYGPSVFVETHMPTTNTNGLVSLEIGTGFFVHGDFESINWASGPYFIKCETDPTGGVNYSITSTTQLLSVPYALHAKTAESLTGTHSESDPVFLASQAVNISAQDITNLDNLSGINTGDQDGTETKITAGTNITVSGTGSSASPYIINSSGGFTHYIGELYGGGIVVAVWKEAGVERGLIASLTNIGGTPEWSSITSIEVGVSAQSRTDGTGNTNAIIAQGDNGGAAYLCNNYSAYGYADWYLPASWELELCYNAAFIVNTILGSEGFTEMYYWTSTESGDDSAWALNFRTGLQSVNGKPNPFPVRAIRKF